MYQSIAARLFKGLLKDPDRVLSDIDAVIEGLRGEGLTAAEKSEFWQIIARHDDEQD